MALRHPMRIISVMILVAMALSACEGLPGPDGEGLVASGVAEAAEVVIVSEMGGTILAVNYFESERVEAGELLMQLDDQMLRAQLEQAEATLSGAQAGYALAVANASGVKAQRDAAIAAAQLELTAARKALSDLYNAAQMMSAKASLDLAYARDVLDDAEYKWRVQQQGYRASEDTINAARASLTLADEEVDRAQKEFNKVSGRDDDDPVRALALSALSAARQNRDAVLRQLNWFLGEPDPIDQGILDAEVMYAEALVADAIQDWETLQNGPDPEEVALLEDRVAYAEAQLTAAQEPAPINEQLAVARAEIEAAQANLAALQVQIDKTRILAPISGVVMIRNIEPGEVLVPGVVALTLADLDRISVTVYIPEDRYGQVNLGDQAQATVDSFPGEVFSATVVRIADRAEFTPRNVQTVEERRTTVFAVELSVVEPDGKLKPGMPVDIDFGNGR